MDAWFSLLLFGPAHKEDLNSLSEIDLLLSSSSPRVLLTCLSGKCNVLWSMDLDKFVLRCTLRPSSKTEIDSPSKGIGGVFIRSKLEFWGGRFEN